jgi:integrase
VAKLTAKAIDNLIAKAAKGEPVKEWHPDGENGLALRVRKSGTATFYVRRGNYAPLRLCPVEAGLTHARREAADVAAQRARGDDPAKAKKAAKAAHATADNKRDKVAEAVEDYIEQRCIAKKQLRSVDQIRGVFRREVVGVWGDKRVGEISQDMIDDHLTAILKSGRRRQAELVYVHLHTFFKWLVSRKLVDENIVAKIERPDPSPPRKRVLNDEELHLVWIASDELREPYNSSIKLMMISGQRKLEVGNAPWKEFDLDARTWSIDKMRTKNGQPHTFPLPGLAIDLLRKIERTSDFVFSAGGPGPASSWGPRKKELDAQIAALNGGEPIPHWTLHDLRRSMATRMGDLGVAPHIVECILNHASGFRSGVGGTYNRSRYWSDMEKALDLWTQRLAILTATNKVTALAKQRA